MTKTSPTISVLHNTHQATARYLHPPTQIHKAVCLGSQHLRISTPMRRRGAEPIRYNKLPLDHQRVDHQEQAHSHHHQTTTGNSQVRSADRQVHMMSLGPGRRTAGAERTVQSVQPMFWKCLTTQPGERAYVAVSRNAGEADRTCEFYVTTIRKKKKTYVPHEKTCYLREVACVTCLQAAWCAHHDAGFSPPVMFGMGLRIGL
jgi:hypothetical protein